MPPSDVSIRGAETEAELRAVRDLLATEFEYRPGLGDAFARLYSALLDDTQVSAGCSRIAFQSGQVVGHILLVPRKICVDGVKLPGGILSMAVVTPSRRRQGIGQALVREAESFARQKGLVILHVAGDRRFYGGLGYVEAYVACRAEMAASPGPPKAASVLRQVSPRDASELARLSSYGVPVGSVDPSPDRWRWVLETRHPFGLLSKNESHLGFRATEDFCLALQEGSPITGYIRIAGDGETLAVYEAGAESVASARGLAGALNAFAARSGYRRIHLLLPPDNPLSSALGAISPQTAEDPELLAKILEPGDVLQRLLPVLQGRLGSRGGDDVDETICLSVEQEEIALALRDGRLSVQADEVGADPEWRVTLPGIALTRAVLGTDSLAERVARRPGAAPSLVDALGTLFPPRHPFLWLADSI